jgi:DNA-nicking Smr family endonuclease
MAKIVVDLHDFFNNGTKIDAALNNAIDEAVSTGTKLVGIIPGKGSSHLKKSVLRFLE